MLVAPSGNDVDCRKQVVVLAAGPRKRQVVVSCGPLAFGSVIVNDAATPPVDCVIVTVCPAIVAVPVRPAPALAATVNVAVPVPVPLAPPDTVMNASLLTAVHAHEAPVVTVTVTVPPLAEIAELAGDTV